MELAVDTPDCALLQWEKRSLIFEDVRGSYHMGDYDACNID